MMMVMREGYELGELRMWGGKGVQGEWVYLL